MTRLLGLSDLIAIRQLQTRGIELDFERAVLWPHTPLQAAFAAPLPFSPVGAETIVLYSNSQRPKPLGFVQSRARRGRPEADIAFLAPALDARDDAVSIWYRLLAQCAHEIGARGGQRLFAQVSSGNGIEDVFRQAGFATYAREDIFRLNEAPANLAKTNLFRHQRTRDGWTLLRLYAQLTPRPVQIAEGMLSPEGQGGKTLAPDARPEVSLGSAGVGDWWDQARGAGYVLEKEGELIGTVRIQRGRAAYWLRFWLHPQAHEYRDTLLRGALDLLWAAPRRPIYCSVRDYESGLRAALDESNFQHLFTRSLMVKHTTARAKEPVLKFVPVIEKRPEPAASVPHHSE